MDEKEFQQLRKFILSEAIEGRQFLDVSTETIYSLSHRQATILKETYIITKSLLETFEYETE